MAKLILIGAGPGDPELISLKAIKALKSAKVVLSDALANVELLEYCAQDCLKVYVGKKSGLHTFQQVLINDMIVDYANMYGTVVRLKGGDPYVFGRGHEELEWARQKGLDVEVIPGISSSLSVPAVNGIPLTKRGVNESFWVVTGHTLNGKYSQDLIYAAQSSATVIILMGMRNLSAIVTLFKQYRSSSEPVAIIQNGTLPKQKRVMAPIDEIEMETENAKLSNPAIIVIGEVVNEARKLDLIYQNVESLG